MQTTFGTLGNYAGGWGPFKNLNSTTNPPKNENKTFFNDKNELITTDPQGRLIGYTTEENGVIEKNTLKYHGKSKNLSQAVKEIDKNSDGKAEKAIFVNFDTKGNKTSYGRKDFIYDNDDVLLRTVTKKFNTKGNLIEERCDNFGGGKDGYSPDGKPDTVIKYIYDAKGNLIEEHYDFKGSGSGLSQDGNTDWVTKYMYDAEGNLIEKHDDHEGSGKLGLSPDGKPDTVTKYMYDAKGNLIKERQDFEGGGINGNSPDCLDELVITMNYDENNKLANKTVERYDNGNLESASYYKINESGKLQRLP